MRKQLIAALSAALLLLTGCLAGLDSSPTAPASVPPPAQPTPTPTARPGSDDEAVWLLVNAEAEGIARQDIELLMSIWADGAVITDANHTPDNSTDDLVWRGKEAIRERYQVMVFPSAPTAVTHPDLYTQVSGSTATARSTTTIGGEVEPGGDHWAFEKTANGDWKITGLIYNLEVKK